MTQASTSKVDFFFRVWLHPEDGDPPEIEVWYHGLENTEDRGWMSEWARESLYNEDFRDLLDLDKEKYYQIVGKGTLQGWHDYYGDYDEEFYLREYEIAEVPESYWDRMNEYKLKLSKEEERGHD